ncbi:MAG: heme NO-binding protein [Sediminimonas qiaohouensis]|uniref:Heme NO-binding protein n=1 Tax=Sediminimonas qiaohouensis TaxID=552061 RepID=A0A7C9H9C3_9RHOB|nr:heme NO-binding domain-containing protein [Sediminimonas qiaohouensis]MTJ03331.1 heme NO-binding protein [Sediminimonas qiaohouensis]
MHGLVNRAIEGFVRDSYGADAWREVTRRAGLEVSSFEPMLTYDDKLTEDILGAIVRHLGKPRDEVLEDIGTYLVSHPNLEALRRLLRFGGVGFVDFLHSLDDLPGRARLAVEDLELPRLELREHAANLYSLVCRSPHHGFGHVMMGVLRALADDYGALVLLEHGEASGDCEVIYITLIESAYSKGRAFDLGGRAALG